MAFGREQLHDPDVVCPGECTVECPGSGDCAVTCVDDVEGAYQECERGHACGPC